MSGVTGQINNRRYLALGRARVPFLFNFQVQEEAKWTMG
jgi:hypothetical protein